MATMINISTRPIPITIAGNPGAQPMRTVVQPGAEAEFADGYCRPVKASSREALPSVIERKSMIEGVAGLVPKGGARHRAWWEAQREAKPTAQAPEGQEE